MDAGCEKSLIYKRWAGTILMEVVLALGLFVVGGMVVFGALSASFSAVERVRLQARAADLAVTKLSEIQMGQLDPANEGPHEYDDEELAGWTWQILAEPAESDPMAESELMRVEIVITNTIHGTTYRLVHLIPPASQIEGVGA